MRLGNKTVGGLIALALIVLSGAAAWMGREPGLAWWALRGLRATDENERGLWATRVAGRDAATLAGVLDLLTEDDERLCANASAALACMVEKRSGDETRSLELARRLVETTPQVSPTGRRAVLRLASSWAKGEWGGPATPETAHALSGLLSGCADAKDSEMRSLALDLAARLLERPEGAEHLPAARTLAQACLGDAESEVRLNAVQLALHPGIDLHRQILPLMRDPSAEVRRLAILVVGPMPDVLVSEDLLRWLHDPDAEVRRLCEMALRGRKLPEDHIRLGRLLTHDQPTVRLQVLDHLHRAQDIDPGVWLRYLSHDHVPAVRAAAMRAATSGAYEQVPFSDRLEQMRSDPSPTVGQLAHYFLPMKRRQESGQSP